MSSPAANVTVRLGERAAACRTLSVTSSLRISSAGPMVGWAAWMPHEANVISAVWRAGRTEAGTVGAVST